MRFITALAAALLLACGSTSTEKAAKPLRFAYPQDGVLRMNDIQMKGTHNSYHLRTPGSSLPDWDYAHKPLDVQLESQGVRQFELDVHYVAAEKRFSVHHLPNVDGNSTCPWFKDCLQTLKAWSDAHRGHHPLIILIEPKDEVDGQADKIAGHYEELDAEIVSVWGKDRLIVPDGIQGGAATLREAVETNGWPTLGEARGKAIFVLLDSNHEPGGHLYGYTRGLKDLHGRMMFVNASMTDPFAGVLLLDNPINDRSAIEGASRKHFLVRTMSDDTIVDGVPQSRARMAAAVTSFANAISTDHPTNTSDAPGYFLDLTGGTPSRCHPLAPKSCKSEDIESKDRLQPLPE